MRRKNLEVKDKNVIEGILRECKVCRISVFDDGKPYIIPMNFGYDYDGEKMTLYFHSALEGRKTAAIKNGETACFEMDCGHKLIEAEKASGYTYAFKSIIGWGNPQVISDTDEKITALNKLMHAQTGRYFDMSGEKAVVDKTLVFKIETKDFTCKVKKVLG